MGGDVRADIIHCQQQLLLKKAFFRQSGAHGRRRVPLAHNQIIAALPCRVLRVVFHLLSIQHGNELHHRQTSADMAHPALPEHFQFIHSDLCRELFQFL